MTKKTNSLIIRYGYSTFWYNKCLAEHRDLNILRLENIIYVEFKKKKLAIFKLYYTLNTLNILVYNIM